jgi:hypothetical protein
MRRLIRPKPRPATRRAVLAVQTLEGREVPAGNVVASLSGAGLLTLVGDNASNALTIRVTGASVTVTGNAGTTVNGQASVTAAAVVRGVQATMNGGDDAVRIDPAANLLLSGPVTVNLGPGNNTLGLLTAGRLTLGSLSVTGGTGNDLVTVAGGAGRGNLITGAAQISLGDGANVVALGRLGVGSAVSITTGAGADTLAVGASNFAGTFSADLGAGINAVRIADQVGTVAPVNFRGAVSIHTRGGNDTLVLGRAVTAGGNANTQVSFNGGVIDGGGGFNFFDTVQNRRTGPIFLLAWA